MGETQLKKEVWRKIFNDGKPHAGSKKRGFKPTALFWKNKVIFHIHLELVIIVLASSIDIFETLMHYIGWSVSIFYQNRSVARLFVFLRLVHLLLLPWNIYLDSICHVCMDNFARWVM